MPRLHQLTQKRIKTFRDLYAEKSDKIPSYHFQHLSPNVKVALESSSVSHRHNKIPTIWKQPHVLNGSFV